MVSKDSYSWHQLVWDWGMVFGVVYEDKKLQRIGNLQYPLFSSEANLLKYCPKGLGYFRPIIQTDIYLQKTEMNNMTAIYKRRKWITWQLPTKDGNE